MMSFFIQCSNRQGDIGFFLFDDLSLQTGQNDVESGECGAHFSIPPSKQVDLVIQADKTWGPSCRNHWLGSTSSLEKTENFIISTAQINTNRARRKFLNSRTEVNLEYRNMLEIFKMQQHYRNRRLLKSIAETILLCAGRIFNFVVIEILEEWHQMKILPLMRETSEHYWFRVRSGNDVLRKYILEGTGNAQYISPEVQNCLLHVSLTWLQQNLLERVNNSLCWLLLCDQTTGPKKRERESSWALPFDIYFWSKQRNQSARRSYLSNWCY